MNKALSVQLRGTERSSVTRWAVANLICENFIGTIGNILVVSTSVHQIKCFLSYAICLILLFESTEVESLREIRVDSAILTILISATNNRIRL